ncbi:MAG TPA: SRPBCC family protein, partial [Pseudonocardia sp.]
MWVYEHSVETSAAPDAIWRLWADVEHWGTWNADIDSIEIRGPFATGTEITMTPPGQDPVQLRVAELTEREMFVDEAEIDGLLLRTIHRLDRLDAHRTRVVYRMEITGPAADELGRQLGPAITADWPDTVAALARAALAQSVLAQSALAQSALARAALAQSALARAALARAALAQPALARAALAQPAL